MKMPALELSFRTLAVPAIALFLGACGGGGDKARPGGGGTPPVGSCNAATEFCGEIPGTADPCVDDQYWPLSSASSLRPLKVHYSRQASEAKALEMIALLEESWSVQVDVLGFSDPISDLGACGPDGDYDVFIWPGIDGAFVSSVTEVPSTPYNDVTSYMAFDPSGINGGALLNSFMAHEFNHAVQASDDWDEDPLHYEAGATFAETIVYPDDQDWFFEMEDFQNNPHWSLFFDDFGATWYTYAAAMYLHYLHERFYVGDPGFYARIWRATRSDVGVARPDYFDALRSVLLNERGVTLDETVVEFMQWRWFVAENDDGAHFDKGGVWPYTVAIDELNTSGLPASHPLSAMVYGANYVVVRNDSSNAVTFSALIESTDSDINWRLLDVASGDIVAPVTLEAGAEVVLVAVVMPTQELWSGNISFDERQAVLSLETVP